MDWYQLARPAIFAIDPETDHKLVGNGLKIFNDHPQILKKLFYTRKRENLQVKIKNLTFDSPIGIAAGFDKKAEFYNSLGGLGAGFVEIGSVTKHPQEGNPKKRVFRLTEDQGIINRMGLNNVGIEETKRRLKNHPAQTKLGISIAPGHGLESDQMIAEMIDDVKEIHEYADYIALNLSCPNQVGVTVLQQLDILKPLLEGIAALEIDEPIFGKFSNDIDTDELIANLHALDGLLDGIILSNCSVKRDNLISNNQVEKGGLSGKPIFAQSMFLTRTLHDEFPDMPIIYSGGVFTPEDAKLALDTGATLVEVYSGFIYNGPELIERINRYLSEQKLLENI
ncbi:quinone-dependent dihydroorotate dehydrogenase [Companilactobacillus keshanensis]|uniref:Dihydroorotate dehydrogenase (quinone) n=1 Tax=Companilactobacillus keshanensis TaxID=2486003 RepID=A0ABW4BSR3_9LACO|nr:quinone-dependent dihydroorotate dehydrogenase [Companilactobacillus keshanensis]